MSVIKDIIDGNLAEDSSGFSVDRVFIVSGLTGKPHTRLYNAMIEPDIPPLNQPHPSIPGIVAVNRTSEPMGTDSGKARITVSYKAPDEQELPAEEEQDAVIQVGSSTSQSETQRDINGDQLLVSITFADGTTDTQAGPVTVESPILALSYQRKEPFSPIKKSILYSGAINNKRLSKYFDKRTLLCKGIEGVSDDGGLTYSVSYLFEYNPVTWLAQLIYKDNETDKPHADVSVFDFNGFNFAEVYEEKDFTKLNLDFQFNNVPDA